MDSLGFETASVVGNFAETPWSGASHDASAVAGVLWTGLIARRLRVVQASTLRESASLVLRAVADPGGDAGGLDTAATIFDAVIRGKLQKAVAIDGNLSPSSVAGKLGRVVSGMGLRCNFMRLPLGVALLAHACGRAELLEHYCEGPRFDDGSPATFSVTLRRCDRWLADRLSKCEYEVARLFLEGADYGSIARARATSVRTVANQMSAVFRKAGVSGRFGLLRTTVECTSPAAAIWDPSARTALHPDPRRAGRTRERPIGVEPN